MPSIEEPFYATIGLGLYADGMFTARDGLISSLEFADGTEVSFKGRKVHAVKRMGFYSDPSPFQTYVIDMVVSHINDRYEDEIAATENPDEANPYVAVPIGRREYA